MGNNQVVVHGHLRSDGTLVVDRPINLPPGPVNITVEVAPASSGWPPGYFELAGSIDDETFVRPPQGELPKPVDLE